MVQETYTIAENIALTSSVYKMVLKGNGKAVTASKISDKLYCVELSSEDKDILIEW